MPGTDCGPRPGVRAGAGGTPASGPSWRPPRRLCRRHYAAAARAPAPDVPFFKMGFFFTKGRPTSIYIFCGELQVSGSRLPGPLSHRFYDFGPGRRASAGGRPAPCAVLSVYAVIFLQPKSPIKMHVSYMQYHVYSTSLELPCLFRGACIIMLLDRSARPIEMYVSFTSSASSEPCSYETFVSNRAGECTCIRRPVDSRDICF